MEPSSRPVHFSRQRQLFWLFSLLTIAYMIWMRSYLSPLTSGDFVRFEIAKTVEKANSIIQEWKDTGKFEQVERTGWLAYLFIGLYTIAIALGCRFISLYTGSEIMIKGGRGFSWLIGVATVCDIIEHIALSKTLHGEASKWSVTIAYNLARVKFSIVIVCILFMVACALFWLIGRFAGEKK